MNAPPPTTEPRKFWRTISRLYSVAIWGVVVLSALLAGLAFAPAPFLVLFQASLVVTEFGHWLLPLLGVVLLTGGWRSSSSQLRILCCLLTMGAIASPAVRAVYLAPSVTNSMYRTFSTAAKGEKSRAAPIQLLDLYRGITAPARAPQELIYRRDPVAGELMLDFFSAGDDASPTACVLIAHGGGWENGTRKEFPQLTHYLVSRGISVASADYRLAPEHTWPAAHDDFLAALDYLRQNATRLRLDPERIVLLGRSAGAQIAAAVGYANPDRGVRGIIALYGPMDMHFAWKHADPDDVLDSPRLLRNYLGGDPVERPAIYDHASPIYHVGSDSPSTLILHGLRDDLVWHRQSELLAARLEAAGVRHVLVSLPWATHAFDYNLSGPGGQITTYAIEHFVLAVTK